MGRENHVYLHYTDWGIFCAYLQVLNLRPLLEEEKLVFLIGDEISQYPIDFQARFGMDYSQYPVKPVGIREIHRLIWHTQLSSHNGGDFFNEIFDNHPNLIAVESVMLYHLRDQVEKFRKLLDGGGTITFDSVIGDGDLEKPQRLANQLSRMRDRTDKDIFVALYLAMADLRNLDPAARIVPSIFSNPTSTATTALWARTTRTGRCWTRRSTRSCGTSPPSRASGMSRPSPPCADPPPPPERVCALCSARWKSGSQARNP